MRDVGRTCPRRGGPPGGCAADQRDQHWDAFGTAADVAEARYGNDLKWQLRNLILDCDDPMATSVHVAFVLNRTPEWLGHALSPGADPHLSTLRRIARALGVRVEHTVQED